MRHLIPFQYIETIAKSGSIRKAADQLAITPSALNRRLLSVEEELGVAIFERLPSGVRLSTAGEILLEHIRSQVSDMERVRSRIADLSGMRMGHVTIAISSDCMGDFLSAHLASYRTKHPGVTFQIDSCSREEAEERLRDYSADIAIILEPTKLFDLQIVYNLSQPIQCIMAKDHPLAQQEKVRFYECLGYPLILPDEESGLHKLLETRAARQGLAFRAAIRSNSPHQLFTDRDGADYITFDIPMRCSEYSPETGTVTRLIDPRDLPESFVFIGHLRGRTLPVASARFMEEMISALASRFE